MGPVSRFKRHIENAGRARRELPGRLGQPPAPQILDDRISCRRRKAATHMKPRHATGRRDFIEPDPLAEIGLDIPDHLAHEPHGVSLDASTARLCANRPPPA